LVMDMSVNAAETLDDLRQRIDRLDRELLALVDERASIARDIALVKAREPVSASAPVSLLRPDREAILLRKLLDLPRKALSDEALIAIWRQMIGESLRIQGEDRGGLHLNFWSGDKDGDLISLARSRFGVSPSEGHLAEPLQVIQCARLSQQIGIIGLELKAGPWWARLLAEPAVRVIAALPERHYGRPLALVVAAIKPEPTGDDISFWATDSRLGDLELVSALSHCGLAAEVLYAVGGMRLLGLSGFIQDSDERLSPVHAPKAVTGTLSGIIGTAAHV
jgi:chorismate mutase